jgi:hypothetical protein
MLTTLLTILMLVGVLGLVSWVASFGVIGGAQLALTDGTFVRIVKVARIMSVAGRSALAAGVLAFLVQILIALIG